jgi:hypothetical protein
MRKRPAVRISPALLLVLALLALASPASAQCTAGNFFVSTSVPGFFPALAPPVGFCVFDNGPGDSNPTVGVIEFAQTVNSPVFGLKEFSGRAEIVNGAAVTGGQTGFGVRLTRLVETTLSTPGGVVPGIPIFVQNTFASNIPTFSYAAVTTSLSGSVSLPAPGNFLISDLGSWSSVPVVSSGHAFGVGTSGTFAPPPAKSILAPGLASPEVVTYEFISTARQNGTQIDVSGSAIVGGDGNATECTLGRFFVATFIENFFPNLLPPNGFCVPDNGAGDQDPAFGSIVFNELVNDPIGGAVKRYNGHAEIIPGSAAVGGPGSTGFGVRLTDFQEETISAPLVIGAPAIPVFVQNTFTPGIPANGFGRVTTSLNGFVQSDGTAIFSIADLGSWAGAPVVSSGHILGVPPYNFGPASVTSPPAAGVRNTEVVTYQFIDTNRQSGVTVVLPGSGEAVADEGPGPAVAETLTLQPLLARNPVRTKHTLTATLVPAAAGVLVTFTVVAGPNAGLTGTVPTDAFGNAVFTYTDAAGPGTDVIQATARGGALVSNFATKDWVVDAAQPICRLNRSGPGFIEILVRDLGSGLASVAVLVANNANVGVPGFDTGTTQPVLVPAFKIDPNLSSQVGLRVTDVAGNVIDCDPVQVTVERATGQPRPLVLTGLPAAESRITVRNGSPGVKNLEIEVNGRRWRVTGLADGTERTLDVSSAMLPGNGNTITVTASGKPGTSADLLISD